MLALHLITSSSERKCYQSPNSEWYAESGDPEAAREVVGLNKTPVEDEVALAFLARLRGRFLTFIAEGEGGV